jgi:hypothetical protein
MSHWRSPHPDLDAAPAGKLLRRVLVERERARSAVPAC